MSITVWSALHAFSHLILKQDFEVDTIISCILEVMKLWCREEKCLAKVTMVDWWPKWSRFFTLPASSLCSMTLQILAGLKACFQPVGWGFAHSVSLLSLDLRTLAKPLESGTLSGCWGNKPRLACQRMRDHVEQREKSCPNRVHPTPASLLQTLERVQMCSDEPGLDEQNLSLVCWLVHNNKRSF